MTMAPLVSSTPIMAVSPPFGEVVNLDNPPSVAYELVDGSILLIVLPTVFLIARLCTRKWIVKALGWDDFWIVCAWICGVVLAVGFIIETWYGSGKHLWDVKESDFQLFLKSRWIIGTAYYLSQAFSKFSVCVFYLRLSPNPTFRRLAFATIIFVACYSIATILVNFFACRPIAAAWNAKLLLQPGSFCVNRFKFYYAQAGLNIGSDVWIVILPMKTIWSLQMRFSQRLLVTLIFASGLCVCAISMVRIKYIKVLFTTKDLTWDNNRLFLWTTIEMTMLLICVSVPPLYPLISFIFPALLGRVSISRRKKSSQGYHISSDPPSSVKAKLDEDSDDFYQMKIMQGGPNTERTKVAISGKTRRDIDAESQEDIINRQGYPESDGIVVQRTVNVS